MNEYNFCPDKYFDNLYKTVRSPYDGVKGSDCLAVSEKIKEEVRHKLCFGSIPLKKEKLEPCVVDEYMNDGIKIKKISVEICDGWKMLCYLLEPGKNSASGVVAVCGHGYGVRQIIRQGKNSRRRKINFLDNYQKNFALEVAKRGNRVIAFEPVAFGEARLRKDMKKPFYISSCETVSCHSLLYGLSAAALRVYQAVRCIDLLEMYGCSKFGIMGISGGGLVSLYASCVDSRIEKTVVCGYVNTFKDSILSMWHCPDNYIPGIINIGEIYDFASALAPCRLHLECGKNDKLFPVEASEKAIRNIERVYSEIGAKENFTYDIFDGKHEINGKESFDFFG